MSRFRNHLLSQPHATVGAALVAASTTPVLTTAQGTTYALENASGLRLHNVRAEPAVLQGRKGLRLTLAPEAAAKALAGPADIDQLAIVEGLAFANGVIEAEIAVGGGGRGLGVCERRAFLARRRGGEMVGSGQGDGRRGGALKTCWTKPRAGCWSMGIA